MKKPCKVCEKIRSVMPERWRKKLEEIEKRRADAGKKKDARG